MFTRRELEYLLRNFEGDHKRPLRTRRVCGRPVEYERVPAVSEELTELLIRWFNSLSPDQKREFFQFRTAYQKIGFLVRWGVVREEEQGDRIVAPLEKAMGQGG